MNKPIAFTNGQWEHFEHESDIGIRGTGATCERAFERAAMALTAVITDPGKVQALSPVSISCHAPSLELLFVEWLNALIYEMSLRQMLFSRFKVAIKKDRLTAVAWGEPIDIGRHQPAAEIKAATYAELEVRRNDRDTWTAQCIIDV